MSILTRKDGVKFAINNYREVLIKKRSSLLIKELKMLAEIHGRFAKFSYKNNAEQISAVFSPEQGYLLGQCVAQHFNYPDNFVYCETLPDSDKAVLVIYHDKQLYLETETLISNIPTELASLLLLNTNNPFDIYLYGQLPVSQTPEQGKFCFEGTLLKSFNILPQPLFPTLTVDPSMELLPFKEALRQLNLPSEYTKIVIGGIILLIVLGYLWKKAHPKEARQLTPLITVSYVDPYKQLEQALSTPAPNLIINQLGDRIDGLLTLPGWQVESLVYQNQMISVTVTPYLASQINLLSNWAYKNNYQLTFGQKNSVTLSQLITLPKRYTVNQATSSGRGTYTFLYDSLIKLFPNSAVSLVKINNHNVYQEYVISITLNNISNPLLRQISQLFRNQPININQISLNLDGALISGTINFSIFGA